MPAPHDKDESRAVQISERRAERIAHGCGTDRHARTKLITTKAALGPADLHGQALPHNGYDNLCGCAGLLNNRAEHVFNCPVQRPARPLLQWRWSGPEGRWAGTICSWDPMQGWQVHGSVYLRVEVGVWFGS